MGVIIEAEVEYQCFKCKKFKTKSVEELQAHVKTCGGEK